MRSTGGRLSGAERRRLLAAIAVGQAENLLGRARLALGRLPSGAREIDVRSFVPPDSRLAREAEAACAEQPEAIAGHSYRTPGCMGWRSRRSTTPASTASSSTAQRWFTTSVSAHRFPAATSRSAAPTERWRARPRPGSPKPRATSWPTPSASTPPPGITPDRDGALGCYVQMGAMVDGAGLRMWDISTENIRAVLETHPRSPEFKRDLAALMRAEARAVPGGRFSLLVKCGVTVAVRLAPFEN